MGYILDTTRELCGIGDSHTENENFLSCNNPYMYRIVEKSRNISHNELSVTKTL